MLVWCAAGLRGSLSRLQLDYVDIVFANRSDINAPMEGQDTQTPTADMVFDLTIKSHVYCVHAPKSRFLSL